MPKTNIGEQISWKEFMKRWGKGIEGITMLQQVNVQIQSTWIVVIGIVLGLVFSIFNHKNMWWVAIILVGALGNTWIQLLGLYQKKIALNKINITIEQIKEIKEETEVIANV